jgi:hypothetical protein
LLRRRLVRSGKTRERTAIPKRSWFHDPTGSMRPAIQVAARTPRRPSFQIFLKLAAKDVAGGGQRPATKLLYQHLSKKAGNLDLNDDSHQDRLWESTIRRRLVFNPARVSRAPAALAVSGKGITLRAKLTFRNYDLQPPGLNPSRAPCLS